MSRGRFVVLSLLFDAILVNVGIVLAYLVRFRGALPAFNFAPYVRLAPLITILYLVSAYIYGLYEPERTEGIWAIVRGVSQAIVVGSLLTLAAFYVAGPAYNSFPRLLLGIAFPLQLGVLVGWRVVIVKFAPIRWPEQRVLIVGVNDLAVELGEELSRRSGWGYRVAGLVAPTPAQLADAKAAAASGRPLRFPVLGTLDDVSGIVADSGVTRVIVASPAEVRELVEDMALADESEVRVDVIPELYEIFIGTIDTVVADIPLMEITRRTTPGWFVSLKRLADVAFGALLLIVASPLLLLAALSILVSMGRPILFKQERVGKDLEPFPVYKLRTMIKDAEEASGPVLAEEDDPRITPLGRYMRRYRVDELPQLVNIIKGDMSFVGPRPEREFFVERFIREIPGYRERFRVKPGVTGLAQVSGGYATTPERKLKYDLIYMYHQSLQLDLQILVETLRVVLTGRGAR